MRKKFLLACVAGTAMAISLTGCGTEDTTTTSATTDTTNSTEASQTQVTGKVSSISDGTVTLALGEVDENAGPGQGGMPGFTESGETQTIDISNATITKDDETIDMSDIVEGDILEVTLDAYGDAVTVKVITLQGPGGDQSGGGPGAGGAPGGNSSGTVTQGLSATTLSEDGTYSDETYTSTGDDENALRIDNATVTLDGITIDKSAGATSSTENGDFYGVNAALLATNGATVTIKNATVTSSAQNGNGVFSYGSDTTVNISDSTITTTADNSGGIQTTGGGGKCKKTKVLSGNTIGVVGGLIVGQAAVEAGIVSTIVVIVVALTAIASFAIPNEAFASIFRLFKFVAIIFGALFGIFGCYILMMFLIVYLSGIESIGVPYLSPLISDRCDTQAYKDFVLRAPIISMFFRPEFADRRQRVRLRRRSKGGSK